MSLILFSTFLRIDLSFFVINFELTKKSSYKRMKPDSLIFDMDGTLWDAVATYAHCWSIIFTENGIGQKVEKHDIQKYMGMEAKQIYKVMFPELPDSTIDKIYDEIVVKIDEVLPVKGGILYADVIESIKLLSTKYKLFMLSNCQKGSIRDFMTFTDTKSYFCDYIEYGSNFQPKHINMKTLIDRYSLKSPMYVGDTDSDRKQSDLASVPFVFASWGFGDTDSYALKFDSMKNLTEYFMNLQ